MVQRCCPKIILYHGHTLNWEGDKGGKAVICLSRLLTDKISHKYETATSLPWNIAIFMYGVWQNHWLNDHFMVIIWAFHSHSSSGLDDLSNSLALCWAAWISPTSGRFTLIVHYRILQRSFFFKGCLTTHWSETILELLDCIKNWLKWCEKLKTVSSDDFICIIDYISFLSRKNPLENFILTNFFYLYGWQST